MNAKELREHDKLLRRWATGRATRKEILRCMELDRKTQERETIIVPKERSARIRSRLKGLPWLK